MTVAFRSPAERPTPRFRQAFSPFLRTAYWLARPLARLQIRVSPEGYFVPVPPEAVCHLPKPSAKGGQLQRDARLDHYFSPAQQRELVPTCLLVSQPVHSRPGDESSRPIALSPAKGAVPNPETE